MPDNLPPAVERLLQGLEREEKYLRSVGHSTVGLGIPALRQEIGIALEEARGAMREAQTAWEAATMPEMPAPDADARDAARWRAVRPLLVGADFEWGEPPEPVACFRIPPGVRVGSDADAFADQLIAGGPDA